MAKHILLAVDLEHSEKNNKTVEEAAAQAKAFDGTLHVITVIPSFGMPIMSTLFNKEVETKVLEKTTEALHDFVSSHIPAGINVQHIVAQGSAYEEILHAAKQVSCELIIMGAHRDKMDQFLLGPNAARVVRHAECSVLVVRK